LFFLGFVTNLQANHESHDSVVLFESKKYPQINLALRSQLNATYNLTVISVRAKSEFCQRLQDYKKSIIIITSSAIDNCHQVQLHLSNQFIIINDDMTMLQQQQSKLLKGHPIFIRTSHPTTRIKELQSLLVKKLKAESSCVVGKGHSKQIVEIKTEIEDCQLWVVQNHDSLSNVFRNFPFSDRQLIFFIKGNEAAKPPLSTLLRKKHVIVSIGDNWSQQGALISMYYDSWDLTKTIISQLETHHNDLNESNGIVYPKTFQVKINKLLEAKISRVSLDEAALKKQLQGK